MNSYGLVALTPNQSTVTNRMHLTKPYEFLWFGCIDTKSEHDNEQDASHHNHMNSYGLAALTPNQSTVMNRMHLTKPYEFLWFGCIDTKPEHDNEQDASHQNHMNSYGLVALTPNQITSMTRMHLIQTI